jgi:hypothetical protein
MSVSLRVILVVISILTLIYVLRKIRKYQLRIDDSLYWIIFSGLLVILSFFPSLAISLAEVIGIISPANFVFLAIVFVLLIKVFMMSVKMSQMENSIHTLTQEIAILKKELNM